jgi:RNA polymerase sigma-70 factor (ECF subfamily)
MSNLSTRATQGEWFASTHWSVVLAAREGDSQTADEALEKLGRTYWPPLYAFIRKEGYSDAEAKDLTQEFFLRLIERQFLRHLRHQQGKFRSFLLTFLKHFLQEHRGRARAQKRGGGTTILSLDEIQEIGFLREPVDHLSPDQVFERRWAQAIFQHTIDRLRGEYLEAGKGEFFDLLKDSQPRLPGGASYAAIGAKFDMTEAAVKSAAQRMRQRHREILREEIARTVLRPEEIEREVRHLRNVLSEGVI